MKIFTFLLIFAIQLELYAQDINCHDEKKPVSWVRIDQINIDLYDLYGIIDSAIYEIKNPNLPIITKNIINDTIKTFHLLLKEGDMISKNKNTCALTLLVINNTDTIVDIPTIDGTLLALPEVFYKNKWYPIEYFMIPWCGNSFLDYPLKPGKCYKVLYSKNIGDLSTKLRYKLKFKNSYLISNSIDAKFNVGQIIYNNKQIDDDIINFFD
jgi:hypothetical protein